MDTALAMGVLNRVVRIDPQHPASITETPQVLAPGIFYGVTDAAGKRKPATNALDIPISCN
ncbi:MAG TPA: hypothetical protein VI653_12400 [Steroidobacteraceae bacterium]